MKVKKRGDRRKERRRKERDGYMKAEGTRGSVTDSHKVLAGFSRKILIDNRKMLSRASSSMEPRRQHRLSPGLIYHSDVYITEKSREEVIRTAL